MSPGHIRNYIFFLWGLNMALEAVGCIAIIKRKLWREIPAFSAYNFFSAVVNVLALALYGRHFRAYFYFYWFSEAGFKILNTWVILEIYLRLMRSFTALRKVSAIILWSALACACIAGVLLWFADVHDVGLMVVIIKIGRSFKMVQLALLLALGLILRSFRLQLRRYYVFISIGAALVACGDLVYYVLSSAYGPKSMYVSDSINLTLNTSGAILWTYVLVTGEQKRSNIPSYAAIQTATLQEWSDEVSKLRIE